MATRCASFELFITNAAEATFRRPEEVRRPVCRSDNLSGHSNSSRDTVELLARLDTAREIEWYEHGGMLTRTLRSPVDSSPGICFKGGRQRRSEPDCELIFPLPPDRRAGVGASILLAQPEPLEDLGIRFVFGLDQIPEFATPATDRALATGRFEVDEFAVLRCLMKRILQDCDAVPR